MDCATLMKGSSPRGRGKRFGQEEVAGVEGLIPAWAGKTCPPRTRLAAPWAHPRVGGENISSSVPPLMRSWLIPAWAGKTQRLS